VSVASFVAAQRTEHGVPHALTCRALELSESWFYKWRDRWPTPRQVRRRALDADVKRSFEASDGDYGSPRVRADLRAEGWRVSKKSVEASMARQGLVGRATRRRFRSLTRPDKAAAPAPDLVKRDFTAPAINLKWCGDLTEVPTDEGKLYLAHVEDLASRRIPGFALSEHHDAEVAVAALQMAAAVRGGDVGGVIFHSDRGSEGGIHRRPVRDRLPTPRDPPVDGSGRFVRRQCGVGELPLDPRVRTAPQTSLRHQGPGESGGGRLHRPLQPDPPAQLL
jgi:transposase InsO family protein